MRWILQPPTVSQIRNPQAVRTTTLMDGSISLAFTGYRSTGNPRPSNYNEKDIEDIQEEEFAGVFTSFIDEYGLPDSNDRWDTLGEPSGKYNFYVNYAAPPIAPFILAIKPSWGDEDDEDNNEAVFPSIWEDTPWEEDPKFDPNDLAQTEEVQTEEEEEEPESYFLGLQEQEMDYPAQAPQDQEAQWGSTDEESEAYWKQVVQHDEQIEAQLPLANGWYNPTLSQDTVIEEFLDRIPQGMPEGTWYEVYDYTEPDELEYPIFRRLAQSISKEKALASTSESAISNYKQPNEPLMGQINYPPAQGTTSQFNDNGPYKGKFKGKAMEHTTWTLPSAQQNTRAMLVLPEGIGFGHNSDRRRRDLLRSAVEGFRLVSKTISDLSLSASRGCLPARAGRGQALPGLPQALPGRRLLALCMAGGGSRCLASGRACLASGSLCLASGSPLHGRRVAARCQAMVHLMASARWQSSRAPSRRKEDRAEAKRSFWHWPLARGDAAVASASAGRPGFGQWQLRSEKASARAAKSSSRK
ncbi:hypothetical protein ZIOFF_019203 [Zingiber officinale]|uniref:Uncharacterized protein n=1 Tax=Zingiber officinale TaxID=94328 RepID=A0A8J5H757_ZINOF|nr:hypothetical protein ZIOFF_019203 [Zingiber officinale]